LPLVAGRWVATFLLVRRALLQGPKRAVTLCLLQHKVTTFLPATLTIRGLWGQKGDFFELKIESSSTSDAKRQKEPLMLSLGDEGDAFVAQR